MDKKEKKHLCNIIFWSISLVIICFSIQNIGILWADLIIRVVVNAIPIINLSISTYKFINYNKGEK